MTSTVVIVLPSGPKSVGPWSQPLPAPHGVKVVGSSRNNDLMNTYLHALRLRDSGPVGGL